MPRLLKYSNIKGLEPLQEVSDNQLRAVEYAGFSYMIDRFYRDKSAFNKAMALGVSIFAYEYFLETKYYPQATAVKSTTKMESKPGKKEGIY